MKENEISGMLIGFFLRVHKSLGPGLLESVYEEAICYELVKAGVAFTRQQEIRVMYDGVMLEKGFKSDIIVMDKVIVEIKSVEILNPVHYKQLLTYLRLTDTRLGLLVNFNVDLIKNGIHRVINGKLE